MHHKTKILGIHSQKSIIMAQTFRQQMSELMKRAWQLVKTYGFTMREAMKTSWGLLKLKKAMKNGIVKFLYSKLDGSIRTAWGTLKADLIPQTNGTDNRKKNESVFVYYDNEKAAFRCFKIANFIRMA